MASLLPKLVGPIFSAPMAGVAGSSLAGAVAKAGGFGFLGAGMLKETALEQEFERALTLSGDSRERLGIGLVGFTGSWLVDVAIRLRPGAIWFSFGDYSEAAIKVKTAKVPLIIMVQSVPEAVRAAELGADAVVAQGNDSGGHGCGPTPTFCFVPEVIDALQQAGYGQIPVLAAGGIADGRQIAAALALGASGIVVGTRFAVSQESLLPREKLLRYLAARGSDTQRTRIYDDLGPVDWPEGVDGRLIRNTFTSKHGSRAPQREDLQAAAKQELEDATKEGNLDSLALWCGSGVGLVHSIESAGHIFNELWTVAQSRLATASQQYPPA